MAGAALYDGPNDGDEPCLAAFTRMDRHVLAGKFKVANIEIGQLVMPHAQTPEGFAQAAVAEALVGQA